VLTYLVGRKPSTVAGAVGTAAGGSTMSDTTADTEAVVDPRPAAMPAGRPIRRLALLFTSGNINLMVSNVILTALILRTFHQSAWLIGVVDALAGSGFIVGAACYGWVSSRISGLRLALFGALGCMAMVALEPLHYIVLMAVIPFAAFCFAQGRIAARTLLMKASPVERVGRVFGGAQAFGLALGVAATVGLSALADATSVRYAFWALVVLIAGIVIFTYVSLVKPMSVVEIEQPILEPAAA
jgi:hypothetical protein